MPATQPAGWMTQAPATHWTAGAPAPGFTFLSAPQSWPHAPQFLESVSLFTHMLPHVSGVPPAQLGRQVACEPWTEQSGVLPPHASTQLPQWPGADRLASQPSSGFAEQWAKPAAQAPPGT